MPTIPQKSIGRSLPSQNPVQASDASCVNAEEVAAYVYQAIEDGSRLLDSSNEASATTTALRRALIVAPLYTNDPNWAPLTSTATDVMLVHKMLVRYGYEERNIRILSDICGGFRGVADPTRENILSSLEWLTNNTQPGDFRFFHFSGHGERILQEKDTSQAKQARRVRTGRELTLPGDYERYELICEPERIMQQTIPERELAYYNEAIVTRYCEPRFGERGDCSSKIMDNELNQHLSNLPPNSTLTCIMDCCASGRITNSNTKARGAGFRGRPNQQTSMAPSGGPPLVQIPSQDDELEFLSGPSTPSNIVQAATQTLSGVVSTVTSLVSPAQIIMSAEIPVQERQMDHIRARTFVRTGCHQRQESYDSMEYNSGLFTRVFARALDTRHDNLKAGVIDYDTLFDQVSTEVAEQSFAMSTLQFVQLWTSIQDGNEDQVDVLLKSPVVI
ncbi:Ca(2+)-dependent cysteine protease [Ceratobasidium sp. 392]|nr:Ca(2+)-dependent cysteine protease [Ceratobasidium sp. 392]